MITSVRTAAVLAMFGMATMASQPSMAQNFPTRTISIVVADSAGTAPDLITRTIALGMSKIAGQQVVVDNKPGAGNLIGLEYVAKQMPADGYTLAGLYTPQLVTLPLVYKAMRFDVVNDLTPVIGVGEVQWAAVVPSSTPWQTIGDLTAYAKANPTKLNYGIATALSRLTAEALIIGLGINVTLVPYKGAGPLTVALLAGESHLGILSLGSGATLANTGKARIIAVTGEKRHPSVPNVQTFREAGLTSIESLGFALQTRAGLPPQVLNRLYAIASQALALPEVKEQFDKMQLTITDLPPAAMAKAIKESAAFYAEVAKKAGMQPQ